MDFQDPDMPDDLKELIEKIRHEKQQTAQMNAETEAAREQVNQLEEELKAEERRQAEEKAQREEEEKRLRAEKNKQRRENLLKLYSAAREESAKAANARSSVNKQLEDLHKRKVRF